MTSEVLVMNSMAVVLAADSALTRRSINSNMPHYSNGGNKIFSLSTAKRANIGIMIYNSVDICGAPWELLIKSFRHENNGKTFKTVKECSDKFFKFISENETLINNEEKKKNFIQEIFSILKRYANIPKHEVKKTFEIYQKENSVSSDLDDDQNILLKEIISNYTQWINTQNEKKSEEEKIQILDENFCTLIFKHCLFDKEYYQYTNNYTGIILSGFGQEEDYPSYIENKCYGFSPYNLRLHKTNGFSITNSQHSCISGFAQSEMLKLLLNRFDEKMHHNIMETFLNKVLTTLENLKIDKDAQLKIVRNIEQESIKKYQAHRFEKFEEPLTESISAMSISELSTLAKTIVELEALNERLSEPSQSVGGPTDIISITKNEGLIWIKRKHYFEKDLNPSYFENLNLN